MTAHKVPQNNSIWNQ